MHENVGLLYYYFHKIEIKRGESYTESPEQLKSKRETINPKNEDDDNCFQYSIAVAINHQIIGRNLQKISKI